MNSLMNHIHHYNMNETLPVSFGEILERFFGPHSSWDNNFYTPEFRHRKLDVKIGEKEVIVTLPFPGCRKSDFHLEVVGDDLTVKAVHSGEVREERRKKDFIRRERMLSSYQESVHLPVKVKGAETRAVYEDGILTVTIPRECACAVTSRVIEVQ